MDQSPAEQKPRARDSRVRWWTSPRLVLRRILMLDEPPHYIALGTTIGMFIGMTPTVGIQMILVVVFAFLTGRFLKFSRVAALLTVYISNPLTVVPIYWFNYEVGSLFVKGTADLATFATNLGSGSPLSWTEKINWLFVEVGWPLIVGSLIVATVCSLVTYPAMRKLLKYVRSDDEQAVPSGQACIAKTDAKQKPALLPQKTENHHA